MSLTAVLVTGLFAGGVSCAAVQGGLLTGLVTRQQSGTASSTRDRVQTPARPRTKPARETRTPARPWTTRIADDLAPVGGFLAGKLLSHAVLGALLGHHGTVVELSPRPATEPVMVRGPGRA